MHRIIQDRDEPAFRLLYRAHTPSLYLFVLRILGSKREDAEDVIQETWIRAVQALKKFDWRSQLHTWLCSIALNCCREWKRKNIPSTDIDVLTLASVSTEHFYSSEIEKCLMELPDGSREVLVMHDIEGYTHKEIGALLEISEGTSKSQLFRARSMMRQKLKPHKEIS